MMPAAAASALRSVPSYQAPPVGRATDGMIATAASFRTAALISATIDRVSRGASPVGKIADYCAGIDCNARRILSRSAAAMT